MTAPHRNNERTVREAADEARVVWHQKTGKRRRTTVVALLALAGMQMLPSVRTNPPVVNEFVAARLSQPEAHLLREACYDCHSHETRWRWYSRVAPASWWIASHVKKGRERLDFSDWPQTRPWEAKAKLESIAAALRDDSMPPSSYRLMHSQARLSLEQRVRLAAEMKAEAETLTPPVSADRTRFTSAHR